MPGASVLRRVCPLTPGAAGGWVRLRLGVSSSSRAARLYRGEEEEGRQLLGAGSSRSGPAGREGGVPAGRSRRGEGKDPLSSGRRGSSED
jgi:hypothetical protein